MEFNTKSKLKERNQHYIVNRNKDNVGTRKEPLEKEAKFERAMAVRISRNRERER